MKQTKFILPAVVLSTAGFAFGDYASTIWSIDVDAYQVQIPELLWCNWKNEDGDIIPDGNLVEGVGLRVEMSAAGGSAATPAIAGIGFDWYKDNSALSLNDDLAGYSIRYQWTGSQALQMELSWDEEVNGYDTWYVKLPATLTSNTINCTWNYFKQDGWDKNKKTITVAKEKSVGLKIRLKNHSPKEAYGTFTLVDLGWIHKDPMVKTVAKTNSAKTTLTNHTLSFSGIRGDANVEIVSLRGQVVLKGTTAAAMDLSRLDAGVYMVRIAGSVNLAQKILLK